MCLQVGQRDRGALVLFTRPRRWGRSPSLTIRTRLSGSVSIFFFSSRRRHTRCSRDWSSDVCSSDLAAPEREQASGIEHPFLEAERRGFIEVERLGAEAAGKALELVVPLGAQQQLVEIGRASCRERV